MRHTRTAGFVLGLSMVWAGPAAAVGTLTADTLKIHGYWDPGVDYLRAQESDLKKLGVQLEIVAIDGEWTRDKAVIERPEILKEVRAGRTVAAAYRHLTATEKASGLAELVVGMYAGILVAHPQAPLDSIKSAKWNKVRASGKTAGLRWSDLGEAPKGKDGAVKVQLPDARFRDWGQSMRLAGVLSTKLIEAFRQKPFLQPKETLFMAAESPDTIAIYGYHFVLDRELPALRPTKLLRVDDVAPNATTIGDGSYPYAKPVLLVFAADASKRSAALKKVLAWLAEPKNLAVAAGRRLLVAPVSRVEVATPTGGPAGEKSKKRQKKG